MRRLTRLRILHTRRPYTLAMSFWTRINPLRDVARPRDTLVWGLFETANHSFTLLIITLLFPIYFRDVVVGDPDAGKSQWGIIYGISSAVIVLLSPIVGAIADARGLKRPLLAVTAAGCILATGALAFVGPGHIIATALLFIVGNVCFVLGENLIASFLPQLSTSRNLGRISALGWAMGYGGGVIVLSITGIMIFTLNMKDVAQWQPLFGMAALWFLVFSIPTLLYLRDTDLPADPDKKLNLLTCGFTRLADTLRQGKRFRMLGRFLAVFLLYSTVVQTIIVFGGQIAQDYGFTQIDLVLFVLQLTFTTLIGALITGVLQDRLGSIRIIMLALAVWLVTCIGMATLPPANGPKWAVWVLGNGLGLGMGMIGTSSRATVGLFTPAGKTAEFFGLWGLTLKLAGFLGPPIFGILAASYGNRIGFIALSAVCVISAVLLVWLIDEKEGLAAAHPMPDRT